MGEPNGSASPEQSKKESLKKKLNQEAKLKRHQVMQYANRRGDIVESMSIESYFAPSNTETPHQSWLEDLAGSGDAVDNERESFWNRPRFLEKYQHEVIKESAVRSSRVASAQWAIDCTYDFKLEIYSLKMIQSDKKQFKTIEGVQNDRQPLSRPDMFLYPGRIAFSPMGHTGRMRHISEPSLSGSDNDEPVYVDSISIRTIFDLRGVLNSVFSDHDFADVKSSCFSLIPSMQDVIDTMDARFNSTVNNYSSIRDELWLAIEEEMEPKTTKIYGYQGDNIEDPFSEDGVMWSVNFFFYNKVAKRVLLLSCRALSPNGNNTSLVNDLDLGDEE